MSQKLYTLLEGKIKRKNADGVYEILHTGSVFVPSPGELSAENHRLRWTGDTATDDSNAVKAAIQNTNNFDYPGYFKSPTPAAQPETQLEQVDDIRTVKDVVTASAIINLCTDSTILEKYLLQEIENKPRVRQRVLKAVDDRRNALKMDMSKA